MGDYKFPKEEKLKGRTFISTLFEKGIYIKKYSVGVLYLKLDNTDENIVKVGVSVPKKRYRRAVDRNRIKRLMREAYRFNKPKIVGAYTMMFIYQKGGEVPTFKNVLEDMKVLIQKIEKRCEE